MITRERVLWYAKHNDPVLSKLRSGSLHVRIDGSITGTIADGKAEQYFFEWVDGEPQELEKATFESLMLVPGTGQLRRLVVTMLLERSEDGA